VGGEKYIKALTTALPQIPMIAAGGVNQQNAAGFILAGAAALGVGTELIPPGAIERREVDRIQELSHRFLGFVSDARERLAPQKDSSANTKTDFRKLHKQTVTR
jgi:2-dehydro-3-deoxyphosphogluconate aldolase/(4S)-4-hydroxy-2-oxoglutarate aldolase